jgi:diadenosine tetraphosphate (Ap4A) HIT family hydrolase
MKKYNDFKKKFEVDRFVIREYKYWIWCLRKNQSTLGSSVLIPQKEHLKLSDLTKEELTELNQVY